MNKWIRFCIIFSVLRLWNKMKLKSLVSSKQPPRICCGNFLSCFRFVYYSIWQHEVSISTLIICQQRNEICVTTIHPVVFFTIERDRKQESPPAWTQEAYRLPRSKCSLCWGGGTPSSHGGGGYPIQSWWWGGLPHPVMVVGGAYPIQSWWGDRYPPPSRPGTVNRQTFPSINNTFPRTKRAVIK